MGYKPCYKPTRLFFVFFLNGSMGDFMGFDGDLMGLDAIYSITCC